MILIGSKYMELVHTLVLLAVVEKGTVEGNLLKYATSMSS